MDLYERITQILADDRLLANLVAIHIFLAVTLILSVFVRYVLVHGGTQLVRITGMRWLDGVGQQATRRVRAFLFWLTLLVMVVGIGAGVIYHLAGRDIRQDLLSWYEHLSATDLVRVCVVAGELIGIVFVSWVAVRTVRRLRAYLYANAKQWLPASMFSSSENEAETQQRYDDSLRRWFGLLDRFAMLMIGLGTVWAAGHIVHLGEPTDVVIGFLARVVAILAVARLLTLACRTLSQALATWGDRSLGAGRLRRYWERITRLFPFGVRCLEAAVYVSAASLCVNELSFISYLGRDVGPRIIFSIFIFFGTRVLIELCHVLLREAFGMFDEDRPVDQKGQTLVPLLESVIQYGLYFGAAMMILQTLGQNPMPIMAGAGILGLAVGLGAQSLVTDVVSGFFILFENQYLVGDWVQIGDAAGKVEAVSIRHTQIRDEHGKLHIIPNGQVKGVVNYSKGYVNAVVDLKVPGGTNLEQLYRQLTEAGRKLKQTRREVISETVIKGLVDLNLNDMTVRTVTRVQPGTHLAMQNEYRKLLKEVFDHTQASKAA